MKTHMLAWLFAVLASPAFAEMTIPNGSFDTWDETASRPRNWTFYSKNEEHSRISRKTAGDDDPCAVIEAPRYDFVQLQQYVNVEPRAHYRLSFRVRGWFIGEASCSLEVVGGGGPIDIGDDWGAASPWRTYSFDVETRDKKAMGVGLRFRGKGAVWIDDVTLSSIDNARQAETQHHHAIALPSIFSNHMVLQRGVKIPIWGWAPAGTKIRVELADLTFADEADERGRWHVETLAMPASGPHKLTILGSGSIIELKDIYYGDVWICAGQSNMQHPMTQVIDAGSEIAKANHDTIRLMTIPMHLAGLPQDDALHGGWSVCTPTSAGPFSAVGYYFGKTIHEKTGVPIGLVDCSWFGTSIIGWTSERAYHQADPAIRKRLDDYVARIEPTYPDWRERMGAYHRLNGQEQNAYRRDLAAWRQAVKEAEADNQPAPPKPTAPVIRPFTDSMPTGIYNAMVHPLTHMPIKGVIWYQGEADTRRADEYDDHLALMVADWRDAWGQGEFPFLFVQIAWCKWWGSYYWAQQCEAQLRASRMTPNSAMVVINDLHDNYDQHPRHKRGVGERLALAARHHAYGESNTSYRGPLFREMTTRDGKAVLHFDHTHGKLVATAPDALSGFRIAGEDRVFHVAEATIKGDTIVASSDKVRQPTAVRYNWAIDRPVCALFNAIDLPMSAFRTDNWPAK